jgi:uncharacterized protein YfaS (alpha-2-macroglobulin family)
VLLPGSRSFEFDRPEQTIELQTGANGTARQEIKLGAGYHRLTLSGEDPQGHKVEVSRWIYVFRTKQDWFERSREEFLMISAEKDSYKPYETARFAIESTFSGPALLTFERGSVINTKMVELTAPLTIVEAESYLGIPHVGYGQCQRRLRSGPLWIFELRR